MAKFLVRGEVTALSKRTGFMGNDYLVVTVEVGTTKITFEAPMQRKNCWPMGRVVDIDVSTVGRVRK